MGMTREQRQQYMKLYYQNNKQRYRELRKQWNNTNKCHEGYKQYYQQNKDKILEKNKQYYQQNTQLVANQHKQYRAKNLDKCRQISTCYYEQNKTKEDFVKIKKQRSKHYYEHHKQEILEKAKRRNQKNPMRTCLAYIKHRAKQRNQEFNLTEQYLKQIWTDTCPVFGTKLEFLKHNNALQTTASLDRIDPTKGYVEGNVQWLSLKANIIKNKASNIQLQQFADWILNNINT
jgi:hypothetical protein